MDGVDVSYLVTVYNKAEALPAVWASLKAQTGSHSREFVFVDDASTDDSVEVLEGFAREDDRVRLILHADNKGPAIRLNEAADAARGRVLHPIDGDDLLPENATDWMLAKLAETGAPLIYGRRKKATLAPISDDAAVIVSEAPLVMAARRPIVHIALLVARDLFLASGGCDEAVFIQDQSLSLRLAAKADRMALTDATVVCAPEQAASTLSADKRQQHHDRFVSAYRLLAGLPKDHPARPALTRLCVSAAWKLRRDQGGLAWASPAFARYLSGELGLRVGSAVLERIAAEMAALPGIRRP
ncbi:glycosyltransferase family 2 protein [Amorphus sp. 3PC139-8]|uniref:glycosyltransferase family 2 protein n=1 Tax=Amorphus sp. 3PC139-8 TaxID=2735676 RepID=UPI00345CE3FF